MLAGVDAVYVGYKNNQLAAPDLNNGIISFMIMRRRQRQDDPELRLGRRACGDPGRAAIRRCPACRARVQAGMPNLLFTTWSAFYAPKGTPREIVLKLNKDIIAAGTSPETAAKLESMAGAPSFTTPEGLMAFTKSEIEAWRKVVRAANIKIE